MNQDPDDAQEAAQRAAQKSARRRRRLAEIFGDVLPDQTADDFGEAGEPANRRTEEKEQEDWLRRQVPPHHG